MGVKDDMKLIIGLGNPGERYAGTRHNIGFEVIDDFLAMHDLTMTDQKFQSDYTIYRHGGERAIIMKPYTYMNLSGEALLPMMSYFGVGMEDIVVIHDDLDLPLGKVRLRYRGSSGGQRGVQNIIDLLGSNEFNRIKMGIGRPAPGWKVTDHVLAPFNSQERELLQPEIHRAANAMTDWLNGTTFNQLMNQYN